MKTTIKISLILLLFSVFLHSASVTIEKMEYLPGGDSVQLFFQMNKVVIPELFYPEKDNLKNIVMRVKDAELKMVSNELKPVSPVIHSVTLHQAGNYTDVFIQLKEQVNHRLFTKQNGLILEFALPKARPVVAASSAGSVPTNTVAPVKPTPAAAAPTSRSGTAELRDMKFNLDEKQGTVFEFVLSDRVNYNVIPIPEAPIRLAIDIPNLKARKINKAVNLKNVKAVRGAYHSATEYRIVFDLAYLKQYSVALNGNILRVSFRDEAAPEADRLVSAAPVANAPVENQVAPVTASAPPTASQPEKTAVVPEQPAPVKPLPAEDATVPPPTASVAVAPAPAAASTPAVGKPEAAASGKEFFGAEKAQADDPKLAGDGYFKFQDEKGKENVTYVRNATDFEKKYKGELVSFAFKNMDLVNLLKYISQISGLNMVIDPEVSGKVSCELVKVPWDQALELFLRINNLGMVQEGNILRIGSADKLLKEAQAQKELRETLEQEGRLETYVRPLSYIKARDFSAISANFLSRRGTIIVDDRTNTIIFKDVPERMDAIDRTLAIFDVPNQQVMIEARIVEATVDSLETFGISWGYNLNVDPTHGNQTNLKFPNTINAGGVTSTSNPMGYAINLPIADTAVSSRLKLGNIANTFNVEMVVNALTRSGKGKLISSPKTTTQNNMEAVFKQGEKIPLQTMQNYTITKEYRDILMVMKVRPMITARNSIVMDIDIQNDVANWQKQIEGVPTIVSEASKTTVMVNDGDTIVIGGMLKYQNTHSSDAVPVLSKIPLIGSLFRTKVNRLSQSELLIFITPRIIKQ